MICAPIVRPLHHKHDCPWHAAGETATGGGSTFDVPVTLDTVPVYLRGGHIIARRERARRSTAAMQGDPLTLVSSGMRALRGVPLIVAVSSDYTRSVSKTSNLEAKFKP